MTILRPTLVLLVRCFTRSLRLVSMLIGLDQLAMEIGSGGTSKCDKDDDDDDDCDDKD